MELGCGWPMGSDPTAACGGNREGSDWQRSARDEGAPAPRIFAGHRNRIVPTGCGSSRIGLGFLSAGKRSAVGAANWLRSGLGEFPIPRSTLPPTSLSLRPPPSKREARVRRGMRTVREAGPYGVRDDMTLESSPCPFINCKKRFTKVASKGTLCDIAYSVIPVLKKDGTAF